MTDAKRYKDRCFEESTTSHLPETRNNTQIDGLIGYTAASNLSRIKKQSPKTNTGIRNLRVIPECNNLKNFALFFQLFGNKG